MRPAFITNLKGCLPLPHAIGWSETPTRRPSRTEERATDLNATLGALRELFASAGFPLDAGIEDLIWQRDFRGRPSVAWRGKIADWAMRHGLDFRHLHLSNTHDGNAHLVLVVYSAELVGIGVDIVHLPRLRRPGKDITYLRRFAAQFMSDMEQEAFAAASADEEEEAVRTRVAAHFSLMEAASKAFGTGLRLGIGIIRDTALPPRSLGVTCLEPEVVFCFGPEAEAHRRELRAGKCAGRWTSDGEYLVSAALLWRGTQ